MSHPTLETPLAHLTPINQGCLPAKCVWQHRQHKLYCYEPISSNHAAPLFFIYSMTHHPSIFDFNPADSLFHSLLARGFTLYLLHWGQAQAHDAECTILNYVEEVIHPALMHVKQKVHLIGLRQGAFWALISAYLYPEFIHSLVVQGFPINLAAASCPHQELFAQINFPRDQNQNISGNSLSQYTLLLKPFALLGSQFIRAAHDPTLLQQAQRLLLWRLSILDQPGKIFNELQQQIYRANALWQQNFQLDAHSVQLSQLQVPILNLIAERDSLVPTNCATALAELCPQTKNIFFNTSHLGLLLNSQKREKLVDHLLEWL